MVTAQFAYTYEYQGNAAKLVHTPLTDKCYLTLTQGMAMGYGGNPYGPAGTGKTESVKALGQAFGRQVLVFNCDEGIDFKSMGRIFIGLIKCGAWGCFDEFNRLLEEQLSAISQQIQVIQWAIKEKLPTLELLGKIIEVNRNSGIFVTMNPAGKGYGGRSKLPDNLKQLFRPVAMSIPDFELIAEVLLFSEGFKTAKSLAQKIVSIFLLAKQLLTPQQHYDWGLRALKTILMVAGGLISEERAQDKSINGLDSTQEAVILIKAIRINTLSKLTFQDMTKFLALLNDVFPGIQSIDISYEELTKSIIEVLKELKLDFIEQQKAKILQFYEATKQRFSNK
jgi:dynein heavy chain 2